VRCGSHHTESASLHTFRVVCKIFYQSSSMLLFPSEVQGRAPGQGFLGQSPPAESLYAFGRLIVQYFAVFVRFSGDNCNDTSRG